MLGRSPSRMPGAIARRLSGLACLLAAVVTALLSVAPAAAADFTVLPDYPIANGHFYSQASGGGTEAGFSVVDDSAAPLFSEFNRLGGVGALGYPSSQRFVLGGYLTQATQKVLLQWHPDQKRALPANVFDLFSERGLDSVLARTDLIPPTPDNVADRGLAWNQVVARHLAILDQSREIKARYFADPDPIDDFGLPQAAADYGGVFVIRCERATFQDWRVATPFAQAGDVTRVNAGDLAKQLGIVPAAAATPESAAAQIVAPPGLELSASQSTIASVHDVATGARASLVRIDVTVPGGAGIGSGIVMDAKGDVLTAEHVVDSAQTIRVTYNGGATLPARVVGEDVADDVAVIQTSPPTAQTVRAATFGSGLSLAAGQTVAALGFSPYFPSPPAIRLGTFQRVDSLSVRILRTDSFILPGDSGGMLLDLSAKVVGVIDAIRITNQTNQPLIGFSIDAGDATRIAQRILQGGGTPTAYFGAQLVSVSPELQLLVGLPVDHGVLVDGVTGGGPADRAGLQVGDVIVLADGTPVASVPDLVAVIERHHPGDTLPLGVVSAAGTSRTVAVTLGAWPGAGG